MKNFKKMFRSVPLLRWADDLTDTSEGKLIVTFLVVVACVMWSFALAK